MLWFYTNNIRFYANLSNQITEKELSSGVKTGFKTGIQYSINSIEIDLSISNLHHLHRTAIAEDIGIDDHDQKLRFGNTYFNKSGDSNNVHFYAPAGFIPHSTTVGNNANLGASSYRWNGVWSSTGNFAGNVVVSGEISSVTAIRHANSNAQVIDNDNDTYFIINDPEGTNRILIGDSGDRTTSFRNDVLSFQLHDSSERMKITSTETTINGDMVVGGAGNGQIKVRHIDGKSSVNTGYDALYLNYATTSPVVIGHGGSQSDLQLNGALRIGTTAVIDTSRNLSNIGTISSGKITTSGTGVAATPNLDIINSSSSTFNHSIEA